MFQRIFILLFLLTALNTYAQVNYDVKIMSWNILNFPSSSNPNDSTDRCPAYREVVNYAQPDVLVTMENTNSNSSPWFLSQVMNTGIYHYEAGTFINGYDSDNAIFYRDSLFEFISNVPINTALRDISHFTLRFKATGDTLHIFALHLKASQGYETQRAAEVAHLRQVTNALPNGSNFLIAGDYNIYAESEPAYTALLQDNAADDGNALDVLNLNGIWNNYSYRQYHTQSTHYSSTGGFSSGGMNDRFDMILYSNGVAQPTGIYYLPGTYLNIGNDGHHFDDAINYGTNTAVPVSVANGLYNASDHLPIMLTLEIGPTAGINEVVNKISKINIYPNPVNEYSKVHLSILKKCKLSYTVTDNLGRIMLQSSAVDFEPGEEVIDIPWDNISSAGFYLLTMNIDNFLISNKIILTK